MSARAQGGQAVQIVLVGALGRMGKAIQEAAAQADDLHIKAMVDQVSSGPTGFAGPGPEAAGYPRSSDASGGAVLATDQLATIVTAGDVVIEFSSPEGAKRAAQVCAEQGAALVSGSTGLGTEDENVFAAAGRKVAVLRAANFSLGVMALRKALAAGLAALPPGWDVEIIERHHRRKVDSPSGTALVLARDVAARKGLSDSAFRSGRQGKAGPRPAGEIGIHAVRGGTWVGDHTVLVAGEGEWLEFRHVAESRSAFAHGALAAARFVAKAPPGLYNLEDIANPPRSAHS